MLLHILGGSLAFGPLAVARVTPCFLIILCIAMIVRIIHFVKQ